MKTKLKIESESSGKSKIRRRKRSKKRERTEQEQVRSGTRARARANLTCQSRAGRWLVAIRQQEPPQLILLPLLILLLIVGAPLMPLKAVSGLRISSIGVPPAVMNSSQVTLTCNYELQGDQLYSVKWYKNYVEFYRFQPNQQTTSTTVVADREHNSSLLNQQLNFGSKQEFELDGINLNLSKSNSTHVYLKQTNLGSEGTYKCEISADSPSFATVSDERQMKVYVLPKQKLSILDNSISTLAQPSNGPQQQRMSQLLVLNPNDLINLTCISGPSRPQAKLSWLINDSPVPGSNKWLTYHYETPSTSSLSGESRLTLAFRLQPNQFNYVGNTSSQSSQSFYNSNSNRQLKIKCIAEFSLEFATETSLAVVGGKKTNKSRNRKQQSPQYSPLMTGGEMSAGSGKGEIDSQKPISSALPVGRLRAARPLSVTNHTTAGVVVWTNRQLRSQAEQIDQILRLTRPNDMQAPLIEARVQVADYSELDDEGGGGGGGGGSMDGNNEETSVEEFPNSTDLTSSSSDRDYELDELVLFTCHPQVITNQPHVQFRWFINDKEIHSSHINHFDGSKFLFVDHHRIGARRNQLSSNKNPPETIGQSTASLASSLLIEFASSLFQLKELNLKCRVSIEQPLYEYENQLDVAITNPWIGHQTFIEAEQQPSESNGTGNGRHKQPAWVLKNSLRQQKRNQVLRLQKQNSSSSALSSRENLTNLPVTVFCMIIVQYFIHSFLASQQADREKDNV